MSDVTTSGSDTITVTSSGSGITVTTDASAAGPDVVKEALRAQAAEQANANAISAETVRAQAAETTLATQSVTTDDPRLTDERVPLDGSVTAVKLNGITANDVGADIAGSAATVQNNLDTEITRAQTAEAAKVDLTDERLSDERVPKDNSITPSKLSSTDPISATDVGADAAGAAQSLVDAEATERSTADALLIPLSQKGMPNGVATLDASGILPTAQLSPLAVTDTTVVSSQAAMLALSAQRGDLAIRSDLNPAETFILAGDDPSVLSNWVQITTPGAVLSVNGQTGTVSLTASDVSADVAGAATAVQDSLNSEISRAQTSESSKLAISSNLSDLSNIATARANLGLGTAATQNSSAFDAAGLATNVQTNLTVEINRATSAEGLKVNRSGDTMTGPLLVNDPSSGSATGVGAQSLASAKYVQSRGQNLVTNGSGLLGTNYNFSNFTFDPAHSYSGGGSFKNSTFSASITNDELIPVDPTRNYRLGLWASATTYVATSHAYFGIIPQDIDGNSILPYFYMKAGGSTDTTLAAPLNPGDTTITLTNATGWYNGASVNYRNFAWYGYTNSKGYTYPNYTYTRYASNTLSDFNNNGLWAAGGITGNVITLRSPWPGPALAAGMAVRNSVASSTYKYIAATNVNIPNTWTYYSGNIGGFDVNGNGSANLFPYGTAFVQLVFLLNRDVVGNVTNISNVWFSESSSLNLEGATTTSQGVVTLAGDLGGTASAPTVPTKAPLVHGVNHLPTGSDDLYLPSWRVKGAGNFFLASNLPTRNDFGTTISPNRVCYWPWDNSTSVTVNGWGVVPSVIGVGGTQQVYLALYNLDGNYLPNQLVLSLDTLANPIDCTTGTVQTIVSASFTQAVTIPPGRYYLAMRQIVTSPTTTAALCFISGQDPRLTSPQIVNMASGSGFYGGNGSFLANPPLAPTLYIGWRVYLQQTS